MTNMYCKPAFLLFLAATLAACGDSSPPPADEQSLASADKYPADSERSPGKPTPPIRFRYEVQGTPIVGQPVAIDVFVSSSNAAGPIDVQYRVNDGSSMVFPEAQARRAEVYLEPGEKESRAQQITVIPQREGRLYLNVSAEIPTADGSMIKTQAIPIQVGAAPPELEVNGELEETADGETVISMPADE